MKLIRYTLDCLCGGTYHAGVLDLSQDAEQTTVSLDLLGDMTMTCDSCSTSVWVPPITEYIEEVEQ